MRIEKSTNRRERPKEVEADPLVGNHERDNTGGAEHLLERAQEPDRVGNVLEHVACDKCVEGAMQLARNGRSRGPCDQTMSTSPMSDVSTVESLRYFSTSCSRET